VAAKDPTVRDSQLLLPPPLPTRHTFSSSSATASADVADISRQLPPLPTRHTLFFFGHRLC
jgi:hypothetical protein